MKKKIILPVLFGGALVASSLAVQLSFQSRTADGWSKVDAISGNLGDVINIPDANFASGASFTNATKITTYPDGEQVMGDSVELTMSGQYSVTYTANVDGEVHSKIETFFVDYPQLKVGNVSSSSVRYIADPSSEGIQADKAGILVNLAYGDTLTFSKPIPVSALTSANILTKLYVVPSSMLNVDFSTLTLTLSNPDDPSNYLKIAYYSHVETNSNGSVSHSSSVVARSDAVNVFAGVHQSQGLHTNDKYGTWSGCTFDGYVQPSYQSDKIDNCMFSFGYDEESKQTYGTGFSKGVTLDKVLDLDDPEQVRKVWGGFTSDRVLLSITCDSYSSTTANFVITDIYGVSNDELVNNIFVDDEEPTITLDDEELPNGAVGYSYPIPLASAYDKICLSCPVSVDVYQNYNDVNNRIKVKVENDHFTMTSSGLYSIVYSAKDYAGNRTELVKSISVLSTMNKPEFDLPEHETSYDVGSYVKLEQNIKIKSYCGSATLKTYYQIENGEKTLVEDGFRIDQLEDYTIYYEATDLIGQTTTKTYQIHVVNNNKPILEKDITFPRYLISKGYYDVPEVNVYLYEDGALVKKEASLYMQCYGSEEVKLTKGSEYNPVITNNGDITTLKIKYLDTVLQEDDIVTIKSTGKNGNENKLNLENYFITTSGENFLRPNASKMGVVTDEERGSYYCSQSGEDILSDFANPILTDNFSITIKKVLKAIAGTTVKITLTDAENKDKSISASFAYDGKFTYFVVNEEKTLCLDNPFNVDSSKASYSLAFNGNDFTYNEDTSLKVNYFDNGDVFTGFDSTKAYVTLSVKGAQTGTNLLINDLCGYIFESTTIRDITSPVIYMPTNIGGTVSLNHTYITYPMYGYDVLSPKVEFTLTVKDVNDNYAKDIDGNDMNKVDPTIAHEIVLSSYGSYTFSIACQEDSRFVKYPNTNSVSRVVYVYDDIAPTINLSQQFQSSVSVGTTIRFIKFTYSDNYTPNDKLVVQRLYIDANGDYHYLSDSDETITFSQVGKYKIMINVIDEYGNIANVTQYVNVSK